VLGHDKSKAARIGGQLADHEIHLVAHAEAVAANLYELAGGDERFQLALEGGTFFAGDPKNL
jgi:hypothetical protein